MKEMQPGDIQSTLADIDLLKSWINYKPKISLEKGILNFAKWYKEYFDSDYYIRPK